MKFKNIFAGLFFTLAVTLFGFFLGGIVGGRVLGSGMGWDRLADALGGMMLGTVFFLALGVFLLRRLTNFQRVLGAVVSLLASSLLMVIFR